MFSLTTSTTALRRLRRVESGGRGQVRLDRLPRQFGDAAPDLTVACSGVRVPSTVRASVTRGQAPPLP